ncbi:hypothetical protein PIB30_016600 [Stylosanthes scabra]|uniref:Uncharacterized protein n=1 Tax=Stylosanthes scabra TaxID=79078 RepID=A0ABU6T745_9FABA|nr:hypothetical protein [Stylosanthes scabra]
MQLGQERRGKGITSNLNGFPERGLGDAIEETSEEELRGWLRDGSLSCSLLEQLLPGSLEVIQISFIVRSGER